MLMVDRDNMGDLKYYAKDIRKSNLKLYFLIMFQNITSNVQEMSPTT